MAIQSVVGDRQESQIGTTVVELVAVDMVDDQTRWWGANDPDMHRQKIAVATAVCRVARSAMPKPRQRRDPSAVIRIDDRMATALVGMEGDEGDAAVDSQRDEYVAVHDSASTEGATKSEPSTPLHAVRIRKELPALSRSEDKEPLLRPL